MAQSSFYSNPGAVNTLTSPTITINGDFAAWGSTDGKTLIDLTPTQATAKLDLFTSALKGLVPASGGSALNFLRADGVWAAPPGGGGSGVTSFNARTGVVSPANGDYSFSLISGLASSAQLSGVYSNITGLGQLSALTVGAVGAGTYLTVTANATAVAAGGGFPTPLMHWIGPDGTGTTIPVLFDSFGGATGFVMRRANGTGAAPTTLVAGDAIMNFTARGYDGTAYSVGGTGTAMEVDASETWNAAAHGAHFWWRTVSVGSTISNYRMYLGDGLYLGSTLTTDPGSGSAQFDGNLSLGAAARFAGKFEIEGTTYATTKSSVAAWSATAGDYPSFNFYKSAGAAIGTHGAIASGNGICELNFWGSDGTSFNDAATILVQVDGAVSAGVVPGILKFKTANSSGTLLGRMTIDHNGVVALQAGVVSSSTTTGTLVVTGGVGISGALNIGGAITGPNFASGAQGLTPASGGGTTNFLRADGAWAAPAGGGSPGGASLTLQYNNAGAFAGMSGTSWDDTNRSLTLTGATVTASNPVLNISQVWNNAAVAFTGLKFNVTATAWTDSSYLLDLQVGGSSVFRVRNQGYLELPGGVAVLNSTAPLNLFVNGTPAAYLTSAPIFSLANTGAFAWSSTSNAGSGTNDLLVYRDAAGILAQRNSTNAQTLRVYNTFTDASNYERGIFDWTTTANVLTIGTQAAGTGTARELRLVGASSVFRAFVNTTAAFAVVDDLGSNRVFSVNSGYTISFTSTPGAAVATSSIYQVAAGVIGFSASTLNPVGWMNWGGQTRVTSDFTVTSSTALVNVTGLSVSVAAGRTYSFEACLMVTDAAAGGVKAAIAGTATATAIEYIGYTVADNAIKGKTDATALATAVASTTTTETAGIMVVIRGTITVNAAGTLTVQMAQNTSNATATTAKRGSYFIVHDMP